ncbi:uncharacterized protein L969DRAFT_95994 [Mixia osmundae IAM 14324]|uniref:ribose-phosphate diphosphokinase n=1 Tax=Mixia osmundae (strain CBS 9802 / IAM 14324 / JCM 22182 / KY 12970) TaxID=764103 RepID=G7DWT2_MIXOS|nr:uncharacterized protein L969DRAFT_97539 [Mixia osmundae IAM 14324]XP_014566724.1 uncharacterized protein L969DRAFT_95994 [Mixia osmundae IAM 14324]KEI36193.1 hypothetical protein L969DRAFT_97539 [Mixia osmundae IAM 14324]KEI38161.1 hypothetical protein L969DRAFT_95994 [Mixia osmundae IAM 14324]GAA95029.1 hypothetical protein E5Q_01684 [Mixia osmundae IAM 14324]
MHNGSSIKLLTGNSHPALAQAVAERLGLRLCQCTVKKFSDNETSVSIGESVREEDVYILQTGFNPTPIASDKPASSRPSSPNYLPAADPNDLLMELLILISACKTASARRITAVIPCFPYSRMDRKDRSRAPITAKLVANMLQVAGCDHVITMDLHASQIQGFFEIPVDNLWTEPLMLSYIKLNVRDWHNSIIVSPDAGGAKRATTLADRLGVDFALINRTRARGQNVESSSDKMEVLVGDIKGKNAILIDDMLDTGETLQLATQTLKSSGAKTVYAIVTHGLLSEDALDMIIQLPIEKLAVTDTICQHEKTKRALDKLDTMSVAPLIAESIRRTHNGESLSLLWSEGGAAAF